MPAWSAEEQGAMLPPGVLERLRSLLRAELGVSLLESDGSAANQDALELLQEIVFEAVRPRDTPVENPEAWAVTIAGHRIADYLRRVRPRNYSMRGRLRYFLSHLPGYAEWPSANGRVAGLRGWSDGRKPLADAIDVAYLRNKPGLLPLALQPSANGENLSRDDWDRLLGAILLQLGGPVALSDLATIVCAVLNVQEVHVESLNRLADDGQIPIDPADPRPSQPDLESREILRQVWAEVLQLLPRQRIALLLNMGDDGDPGLFAEAEVVSLAEICRSLGLTPDQYEMALRELLREACQSDADQCTVLLRHAPLADMLIARLLGSSRDQVIGLRRKARERLARRIGNMGKHSTPITSIDHLRSRTS